MFRCCIIVGVLLPLIGCSDDDESEPPPHVEANCAEHEIALPNGSCVRPGIPVDGCAAGFAHDGEYACEPILPADVCPTGLVAIPGETACRPVMPCGEGKWGALAVDASTVYVDVSYTGGTSNGSASQPWTTIGAAVQAAPAGALIAVAQGSYAEQVSITDKPVRLWGVCPERVEIVGTGLTGACPASAVCIAGAGSGSEVGGLALRGGGYGVVMSGADNVVLDRLWVHDTALWGISADRTLGPVSFTVKDALVERTTDVGIIAFGSNVTIERTTVRATQPRAADSKGGAGMYLQIHCTQAGCDANARTAAVVTSSVVEQNHETGILIGGSDVGIDATVVRLTQPSASDQTLGQGIAAQLVCQGGTCEPLTPSKVTVRQSFIDRNHDHAMFATGSDATIEATVMRATESSVAEKIRGVGFLVQHAVSEMASYPSMRGTAHLENSLIEDNHDVGLLVMSSDVTVDGLVVRRTLPAESQIYGLGMAVQTYCPGQFCDPTTRSTALVRNSLFDENHVVGYGVFGSEATLEASVVRRTLARAFDGAYGDGIGAFGDATTPTIATLRNVRIQNSARAGLSSFGAHVVLADTRIDCAAFELAGDQLNGTPFVFEDSGGNLCGCPVPDHTCKNVSAGLLPPEPVVTE